jgi:hypothetical protein
MKEHLESKVYPGMGSTTAAYIQPWYDEKGVYHYHEGNTSRWEWSCSRGHKWVVINYGSPCPAGDFNRPKEETIILETKAKP